MTRNPIFAPLLLVLAVALSALVAVAVYGVRVAAVQRGVERALGFFDENHPDRGFAQLMRIDCWADQHPALMSEVRAAAIRGYVHTGNDDAAVVLADRELDDDRIPAAPSNVWQALFQVVAEHLDPIWLQDIGGRAPNPKAGYRALQHALQATGDTVRLARLDERIAMLFGPEGLGAAAVDTPVAPTATPTAAEPSAFGTGQFGVAAGASIRCYNRDGKHCGDLTPGTLVDIVELRENNGEAIALCRLTLSETPTRERLIRMRDLLIRKGDLQQLPADVRALLIDHGRATSELRQARRRAAERNPHATSYKKATAAYKAFVARVKRLTAARDEAEGNQRTRYADELHALKNEAPALREAYETAKEQYEAWKATPAGSPDNDPAVVTCRERVDTIAQQLAPYFNS